MFGFFRAKLAKGAKKDHGFKNLAGFAYFARGNPFRLVLHRAKLAGTQRESRSVKLGGLCTAKRCAADRGKESF
jgi:hypothetical protein